MSGGGGGSGNDSGNDMEVSGYEAAMSNEKGISTHSDTQVSDRSFSQDGNNDGPSYGYGDGKVDPGFQQANTSPRADTSTVGIAAPDTNYSNSEVEKGYTDTGEKLSQVGAGKYMTKQQMYNTGIIEKSMVDGVQSGEDVQGRVQVNPNTGELERTDMTFSEHWKNAPSALKMSPTLRFLYASGKNVGEWANKKGFEGYNEAGKKDNDFLGNFGEGFTGSGTKPNFFGGGDGSERNMMNALAPEAPYIVSGITPPNSSPAANWYSNLGTTNTNQHGTSIATQYAAAKSAVSSTLQNKGAIGMLAVNDSPYYDWLKTNKIDKGIL